MSSSEEPAARARFVAAYLRFEAARKDLEAAMFTASDSLRRFANALRAGEVADVAAHPDLAELNLQLDGFYGDRP